MIKTKQFILVPIVLAATLSVAIAQNVSEAELEFWRSIKDSKIVAEYQAYIDAFPDGQFVGLARVRMKALSDDESVASPSAETSSQAGSTPASSVDEVLWLTLKNSRALAEIDSFIATFPDSPFVADAQKLRDEIAADPGVQSVKSAEQQVTSAPEPDQIDFFNEPDWLGDQDEQLAANASEQGVPPALDGERAYLGVELQNVPVDKDDASKGQTQIRIIDAQPFSAAEAAGILPGDIILSFNNKNFSEMSKFVQEISGMKPNERFSLEVLRGDKTLKIDGELGSHRHRFETGIDADHAPTILLAYNFFRADRDYAASTAGRRIIDALKRASERGTAQAYFTLALFKLDKLADIDISEAKAQDYLRRAADGGVDLASAHLGQSLMYGLRGFSRDVWAAEAHLLRGAAADVAFANVEVGILYAYYREFEGKRSNAIQYLERSAEQNQTAAYATLGQLYFDGDIVTQDHKKAVEYLAPAAEAGNIGAKMHLGRALAGGLGIDRDTARAEKLLVEAAEAQYWSAPHYLANFYYGDEYGRKDGHQKSLKWFLIDVERGDLNSAYSLAWLYSFGDNVSVDHNASGRYLLQAIEGGNEFALTTLADNPNGWPKNVRFAVQRGLKQKGYYSGGIDGQIGPGTVRGLRQLLESKK